MFDINARIIFQVPGQPVGVLIPCDCGLTTIDIGNKDVPEGLPFWIISVKDIPEDRTDRNAWVIDTEAMGEPAGLGGTYVQN